MLRAGELAEASGGRLVSGAPDTVMGAVRIDSRKVGAGELFVAIRGERLDGHLFVGDALEAGARGIVIDDMSVVDRLDLSPTVVVIVVADTTHALQQFGRLVRRRSGTRVVAITGSVGKTTTKELAAAGLAARYDVSRTEGNLNNHIGLPLSLLELGRRPDVAVLELGMNHAGEIRTLVGLAEPECRVWTNVAEVHAEFFESIDAIADAKAEILEGATGESSLIANADDGRVMARVAGFPGRVTTFGFGDAADVRAVDVRSRGLEGMEARVRTPVGEGHLELALLGEAAVANALAAVAVALEFQVPLVDVMDRLSTVGPERHRGEVITLGDVVVVDDSYNSNPLALERALATVAGVTEATRRVAVVGEMLELGDEAEALHRRTGHAVARERFDVLVTVGGRDVDALAAAAIDDGLKPEAVHRYVTSEQASDAIGEIVRDGDVVLVKGSRGVRMDRIVDRLSAERG